MHNQNQMGMNGNGMMNGHNGYAAQQSAPQFTPNNNQQNNFGQTSGP